MWTISNGSGMVGERFNAQVGIGCSPARRLDEVIVSRYGRGTCRRIDGKEKEEGDEEA